MTLQVLDNGQELRGDRYGMDNPDLNNIAAYYAAKFNDQATLDWLNLQHPAPSRN